MRGNGIRNGHVMGKGNDAVIRKSALTTSKKRIRSMTAQTAVKRPVWTVTTSVRKEGKRREEGHSQ